MLKWKILSAFILSILFACNLHSQYSNQITFNRRLGMKISNFLIVVIVFVLIGSVHAQNIITFDDQGWNANQLIGTVLTTDWQFQFLSNRSLVTNYGYNFNINGISIYYLFEPNDSISITTSNFINLISIDVYQVSETNTDSLLIEGWNGNNKIYSKIYTNLGQWQTIIPNYNDINRFVLKSKNVSNKNFDYNFDNIIYTSVILPVELIDFALHKDQYKIILTWKTATEINNYGFEIEKLGQSSIWEKIGFVNGNGNSNISKSYSFVDYPHDSTKFQYRLKQIDNDGNFKYSKIILAFINPTEFSIANYPNPFNTYTKIRYTVPTECKIDLITYNILGEKIDVLKNEIQPMGIYEINYSLDRHSSGIYFVSIIESPINGSSGNSKTIKIDYIK